MSPEQEEALLANVKAITDHMTMVDKVFSAARLGVEMLLVFECGESGLFYPSDYAKNWGRPWGDGLGPDVCSESLQTNYYIAPPEPDRNTQSITQIMHPLQSSKAQMDAHLVEAGAAALNMAIYDHEDFGLHKRAEIIYTKQLRNPLSKIAQFKNMSVSQVLWAVKKEGAYR